MIVPMSVEVAGDEVGMLTEGAGGWRIGLKRRCSLLRFLAMSLLDDFRLAQLTEFDLIVDDFRAQQCLVLAALLLLVASQLASGSCIADLRWINLVAHKASMIAGVLLAC